MKLNVLLIAVLMAMGAGVAVAKEDPSNVRLAVVPVKGSEVFKVIYKGESTSRVRLTVYNAGAQVVFHEVHLATEGFIRPLNFEGLKAGEYTIELIEGTNKRSEKVTYSPSKGVASSKAVHVSRVSEAEGKFLVSVANAGNEEITVRILDRFDNVLYSETRVVAGDFAQVYRVKASAGVKFEISDASGLNKTSRF